MFFATPAAFRSWLRTHHASDSELVVGFYKKASGLTSITWPEARDQALCFGWIDSVRHGRDDVSYTNRFTPRRRDSNWSAINVERVEELTRSGQMHPAGLKAFEQRSEAKTGIYSYEQREAARLDATQERRFRSNREAWEFFQSQAPWYRKAAIRWVVTAKKEETRERHLATLIQDSAHGRTIAPLTR